MLQIRINQTSVDITPDISIAISFDNPFFEDDEIPTPHTYSFDIPATTTNLAVVGHAERVSSASVEKTYFAEVLFDGMSLAQGNLVVNEINDKAINVEIECATFIDKFRRKLHQCDLGRASFGIATTRPRPGAALSTGVNAARFDQFWIDQLVKQTPDYIAAPLAVKDGKWGAAEDDRPDGLQGDNLNIRNMRINQYTQTGYSANPIVPAFRIAYLLRKLSPTLASAFGSSALDRLMLICNYHPNYQNAARAGRVWTINPTTNEVYVDFADYMPDIETGLFVNEMLKLVNASLYTINGEPTIAFNKDILNSADVIDWTAKVIDGYSVLFENEEHYRMVFDSEDDEELSPDNEIKDYVDLTDLLFNRRNNAASFCRLSTTGQVFDSYVNTALSTEDKSHYTFELVKDSSAKGGYLEATGDAEDDGIETREVSIEARPVRTVLVEEVPRDGMRGPIFNSWASLNPYNYIPEVEKVEKTRPTTLYIGHYAGLTTALMSGGYQYPQITAIGVAPSVSLVNNGIYDAYHKDFASWLSKKRHVIKGQVQLQPSDIHFLDMRKKIGFMGRTFLIRSLTVSVGESYIDLADFELVEV